MKTEIVTQPTGAVVSIDEVKKHLRVDHTADDGYIQSLIMAAVAQVETITNRRLLTQTWKAFYDSWPSQMWIPFGNLQSVTHIKYTDSDGTQETWDSGEYSVDNLMEPGRVVLAYGKSFPSVNLAKVNPIEVQFVCGYGDQALKSISNATNASPIAITSTGHGFISGDRVLISSVGGNTNANGSWLITRTSADAFTLNGSAGNAAYTASTGLAVKLSVPEPLRIAVLIMVGDWYRSRESIVPGVVTSIPGHIENLIWPYRIFGYDD